MKALVVLAQVKPGFDPVDGSIKITADCGHECWCSPGTVTKAFDGEMDTMCVDCFGGEQALKQAILSGKGEPASREELIHELRKVMLGE